MTLNEAGKEVFDVLKNSEELKGAAVIKAFPYQDKPSRPDGPVIAVYPAELDSVPASIGSAEQYGTEKVIAEVYAPLKQGAEAVLQTAKNAVTAVLALSPNGISVSRINADDRLGCLYISCAFSFEYFTGNTEG